MITPCGSPSFNDGGSQQAHHSLVGAAMDRSHSLLTGCLSRQAGGIDAMLPNHVFEPQNNATTPTRRGVFSQVDRRACSNRIVLALARSLRDLQHHAGIAPEG